MKLRRSIIVKKISVLIALVFVMGAIAQSALAQNLVRFSGGIGDISTGSTNTTVRGVAAAGQIWVIRDLAADVKQDGSILVDGRGLLLGAGDAVGSNANASVFATLFCANDGNVQHSSNLTGVQLEVNGDFRIKDNLSPAPPNTCASPVLLIRVTGNGAWFAAGIPR
jgi:ribosomal protein L27